MDSPRNVMEITHIRNKPELKKVHDKLAEIEEELEGFLDEDRSRELNMQKSVFHTMVKRYHRERSYIN